MIEGFRLSPQQEHIWLQQQDFSKYSYNSQLVVNIKGSLQPARLKAAIAAVVNQFEILRTAFCRLPNTNTAVQVIHKSARFVFDERDLQALTLEEQQEVVTSIHQRLHHGPVDMAEDPLLHVTLITLTSSQAQLLIHLPALCADTIAMHHIFKTICAVYQTGSISDEEEPIQYADVAEVLNDLVGSPETAVGRRYWATQDFSLLANIQLPLEKQSITTNSFEIDTIRQPLASDLAKDLIQLAQEQQIPLATLFFASWQLLVERLTEQSQVVIGKAYDGRIYEELEDSIGLFSTYVPVPTFLKEPDMPFTTYLNKVVRAIDEHDEWQGYFHIEQTPLRFLPFTFDFVTLPKPLITKDVTFSIQEQYSHVDQFKMKLTCWQKSDGINITIDYDTNVLAQSYVEQIVDHFFALLVTITQLPHTPIQQLPLLSEKLKQQLVFSNNQKQVSLPDLACIHQRFEAQVKKTPSNAAIIWGEQQLTYADLNNQANQLAHYLLAGGLTPETRIGLCMTRSPQMLVALFGILKAGGAYVPLDPTHPQERLQFIINESNITSLITETALQSNFPNQPQLICLDAVANTLIEQPTTNPNTIIYPDNLAYILYTSGSTGTPKGVMVQHRSVVNLAVALQYELYRDCSDIPLRITLNAPITFDASVKQWVQLLHGRTLCIIPEDVRPNANKFLSFIRHHQLDVLDCTPTQLESLLQAGLCEPKETNNPAMVLVGGEALHEATWRAIAQNQETSFVNVYGPTECTVNATALLVRQSPNAQTIGMALPNIQVYVLNEHMNLTPIGVSGEIYIGGAGVTRGYLKRPRLTAAYFVPDPFTSEHGARLYKTGDNGRYLANGYIQFLGRTDYQVKLRGVRIELGEIEATLCQHEFVDKAVVVTRTEKSGAIQLVAYVTLHSQVTAEPNAQLSTELRYFLRQKLPEYMVPTTIALLSELPVTRHGKIDRRNLPNPQKYIKDVHAAYEAPRNQIEQMLAAIWQETLGIEKVGVHHNFFDLGGHSLLMAEMFDKLQTTFDKKLSMVDMFRHPTISTMAQHLSQQDSLASNLQKVDARAQKRKQARQRQKQTMHKNKKRNTRD